MPIRFTGRFKPRGRLKINNPIQPPPDPPVWITNEGSLGVWNEGESISYALIATDPQNDIKSYSVQAGTLPGTVTLNTLTGRLQGTLPRLGTNTVFAFTIRALDKSGLFTDRVFQIDVKDNGSQVFWDTPEGSLGTGGIDSDFSSQVKAQSYD